MNRLPGLLALLASTALFAADPAPPAFRLGDAAAPIDYDAHLAIDPGSSGFNGVIRIRMRVTGATPVLWLNAAGLGIDEAQFAQGARAIDVRVVPGGEDFVGFEARGEPFAAGEALATIRYHGPVDALATRGLFRQKEGGEWYVFSQLEAISARRAFPCFDEPQWKTPWRLTVDAPASDKVTSNTPEEAASDVAERPAWRRHVFAPTRPLPSYLVALAVGPFDIVDGGKGGAGPTPLRYVVPKGRASDVRVAREITPRLVGILEEYFGTPFPFPKLDTVAIPATVNFGAMENAGMITYTSSLLVARPFEESLGFRRRYASVAAHEMAHQWFGDLVTLAWWDDAWLNEAFATWMANKALDGYEPDWNRGWWRGYRRRRALEADRLASARRVRNPVLAKTDIWGAFDHITYDKGGEVLSMFEAWLGPERFRKGVRDYLAGHAEGNATSRDFFAALGEASKHPREALAAFGAFIEQPGAPQLDVALRCEVDAASIEVDQHRFRPVGSSAPDSRWTTPACFRYRADGGVHEQCFEISNGPHRFALAGAKTCPDWIVGNADGVGDYLPRYDPVLLGRIGQHLSEVPEAEAVAFAGDAALLARTGLLPLDAALDLAGPLLRHPSAGVKQGGVALLDRLRDEWLSPPLLAAKREVIEREVLPLARRVGWVERERDAQDLRELRVALLPYATRHEDRDTLKMHARELALRWLVKRDSVAATMVEPVLETAGRFADAAIYERLEAAMTGARDRRERAQLQQALARVRDPRLRDRALALALDDRLDGRDALDLLEHALEDDANRAAAFDFVRGHFDALVAKLPPETPGQLATPLGELCTSAERDAFAAFFRERSPRFLGGPKRYAEALESIDQCIVARGQTPISAGRKSGLSARK